MSGLLGMGGNGNTAFTTTDVYFTHTGSTNTQNTQIYNRQNKYLLDSRAQSENSYVDVIAASGFVVPRDVVHAGRRRRHEIVIGRHLGGGSYETPGRTELHVVVEKQPSV